LCDIRLVVSRYSLCCSQPVFSALAMTDSLVNDLVKRIGALEERGEILNY
jgi:hypothetical protein